MKNCATRSEDWLDPCYDRYLFGLARDFESLRDWRGRGGSKAGAK
jgi:hypothetical protein